MGSVRLAVVGLCVALAAGCGDNSKPPGQSQPPPSGGEGYVAPAVGPWVRFAPSLAMAEASQFRREFPLRGQRDIIAVVAIPDAPGARFLRFEIVGPTGAPFNTTWQAFATQDGAPETLAHPETGSPEFVQRVKMEKGAARVLINIGVGGSAITKYSITGTFNVAVHLDGSEPVCVGSFEIRSPS